MIRYEERKHIYCDECNEVAFICKKENKKDCPVGNMFDLVNMKCKYLINDLYCDNKFIHSFAISEAEKICTESIMSDSLDIIGHADIDRKEIKELLADRTADW